MFRHLAAGFVVIGAFGATDACAETIFASESFHGVAEVRLSGADGEKSWLDGGFGKTSVSGGGDNVRIRPSLSEASLEWKPQFGFAGAAVVAAQLQPDIDPALDLGEAYLTFRTPPSVHGRLSFRAGLFYPPVSQEHDGVAWTIPDMLSASAINSWIGEEVKTAGLEATFRRQFGEHGVSATAAVFDANDTSGTLLTFRGWALHSVKTGLRTHFDLPPLSRFMRTKQAPVTDPVFALDERAGYYGALEWRPPAPFSFNALYYDNAGNRIAVKDKQWAWETRFLNVGAKWEPNERTRVLAQAMKGETLMGFKAPREIWIDMGFAAAYVLVTHAIGEDAVSGRVDWFESTDRTYVDIDNNDETGWALTLAWRKRLTPHADFLAEAQHVDSKRPSRSLVQSPARRRQTVLQTALKLSF
jgi:hypothetical protein